LIEQCFQIGEFFLDPANRLLRYGEAPVSLSPKAFDALVYLVRNPGRLLTRDELMQALWPDSYVEEGNLSVHIFQVRRALGTAADGKAYIQTVPTKGYRFNGEVKIVDQPDCGLRTNDEVSPPPIDDRGSPELPADDKPSPPRLRSWMLFAGGAACVVALVIVAARIIPNRQRARKASSPTRLTSFSPELAVSAAAISPDGKTLAYANPAGIFLEETSTKETHRLPSPASGLRVSGLSWFPDGSRLLAAGTEPQAVTASVWIVPAKGAAGSERVGPYRSGAISPDGSQIALVQESNRLKQLLLLPAGGGQPRRLATIPPGVTLGSIFWSIDGQRLHFVTTRWNAQLRGNQGSIRSVNLSTGKTEELLFGPNLSGDAIRLPDGRLLYGQLLGANPAGSYGGELREARVDSRTDKAASDSVSFGRWTEPIVGFSSSADGRRLVFRTVLTQHNVYEGDLQENGKSLSPPRRLTFGKGRDDFPRAWTPDGKAIFFDSNRNGKWEIFRQGSDQLSDEPYLQGANDEFSPRMSPDGRSLLYLDRPRDWREPQPVRLMRVSSVEGFPQFVLQTSGYSEWGLRFECARRPRGSCVLAQRDGGEIVFRRFDSEHGFDVDRSEILRVPLGANLQISWALSPDGSHLAWIVSDAPDATIHVVSLRESGSGREGQVVLKDASHLHALNWSPEGEGWFVTTRLPASWEILHATEARTDVLWRGQGEYSPEAWPSPDGRHLAFSQEEQDSNVWMMEDF
jgi:DNA-binding winged helix-turn-helix (wHTH) protein/Tol biopolymer transport system component